MRVPSFLLGEQESVEKACRARAKLLKAGTSWNAEIEAWIDTAECTEPFVLRANAGSFAPSPCFHMYAPIEALFPGRSTPAPEVVDRWLAEAVQTSWGALCVASDAGRQLMQRRPERQLMFLDGLVEGLPDIEALGARFFTLGLRPFQNVPSVMYSTLRNLGTPSEQIEAVYSADTSPPGGLAAWLRAQVAEIRRRQPQA